MACAECGALFPLRQIQEQLEGRKKPTPAELKEAAKAVEEEAEITCPECGAVFLVWDAEDEVACPNPKCRYWLETEEYKEKVVFKGKAEINPHSEAAEVADCYVTEGHVVIASRELLRIPLQSVEDCDVRWEGVGGTLIAPGTVRLGYRDASWHTRTAEFQMGASDAGSLRLILFESRRSFLELQETFRDPARQMIWTCLTGLGIDAQLARRGRAEENIECGICSKSCALIGIPDGPIRWVNVIKRRVPGQGGGLTAYFSKYGVPDPRLGRNWPRARIESVRIRTFPFGRVVDLHWKGKDLGLGIIRRLNSDISIKGPIMRSRDVIIRSHGDHRCWIISTGADRAWLAPSSDLWSCHQAIARHLLVEWSLA